MPPNYDVRNFSESRREQLARVVQQADDWKLPQLSTWNYGLCRIHARGWVDEYRADDGQVLTRTVYDRPKPGCRKCGIHFRKHQRVGIAWMYLKKKCLLADTMGPQPLSARVLTPTGWSTIGQLEAGSSVVDPATGRAARVAEVLDQGVRPVYRVTLDDGSTTLAADTHLWRVTTADDKSHGRPWKILTTAQLLATGLQMGVRGNTRWYLPLTAPVELESTTELSLDPYTLGVLLGDGGFSSRAVTLSTDHEIVQSLVLPDGASYRLIQQKEAEYSADYRMLGLRGHMQSLDLGRVSSEKRVPSEFLWASVADRVALLQGLLDTDGTASGRAGVEWGSVSAELADAMAFLVSSLGGTYSRALKHPTFTYRGERRTGQPFHRFHISLPASIVPFRLQRKLDKYVFPTKYHPTRGIVSIELVGAEPVRCIRVASDNHLYITDDFIVTHNSGKTTAAGGLISMLLETGELSLHRDRSDPFGGMGRVIIVPRSPALHQWRAELLRMMPTLNVLVAEGTRNKRTQFYLQPWQVLLIGPEMLRNDYQLLENFDLSLFLTDDIDQLRNPENVTSYVLDRMGSRGVEGLEPGTDRYVIMTGTPLQKRLPELHAVLDGIGGLQALGDLTSFKRRHVRYGTTVEFNRKTGREEKRQVVVGYRDLDTVKARIAPMVLRRTAADLDDVDLPTIISDDVMLDLYPSQRAKYTELRKGVLKIIRDSGTQTKRPDALAQLHYGAAICGGLAALGEPDGPGTSVKMDWIIDHVSEGGDLGDEKVVIFANLKNSIRALQSRLQRANVGFVTVWGEEPDKRKRAEAQERFWTDPGCRVLLGTRAIEQSLNLQVARHLINMDMILNPARMEQLAGRIRRDGSAYPHVFVHNLLTVHTQEERYLPMLEREAALSAHIWDEDSQLFNTISPLALLQLIAG